MEANRVVNLTGVHNFRDYGGYALPGGARLKRGLLWRSGQHHEASDADLAQIGSLGLAQVFDLRSDRERASHPCRRPEGFVGKVLFEADGTSMLAPHVAAATSLRRDPETTRENMRRSYRGMPYRPKLNAAITVYLNTLADKGGASLINCMAGKDRTGFAVAMFHHAVGVHRDDTIADYLLTNSAGDQDARIAAGKRSVSGVIDEIDDDALRVLMGVEADYLEGAFDQIIADHGSIDAYQAATFGVDERLKERLRAQFTGG